MKYPILTYGINFYNGYKNIIIVLFLCDDCNYFCKYCGNKFPRKKHQRIDIKFLYNELIKLLQCIDGKIFLDIIGGEPTLHPDFYLLCKMLSNYHNIQINVYTNFSNDANMYIELINIGINIIPSWHSLPNDPINNNFIKKILYVMLHTNTTINIRIMYEPYAIKESIYVCNQLHMYDRLNIELSLIINTLTFNTNYTNDQLIMYNQYVNMVKDTTNNTIFVKYNDDSSQHIGYYDIFNNMNFRFWKCNAGKDSIYIHSDGNIYACPKFYTENKTILYNIYKNGIEMSQHGVICPFTTFNCECDKDIMKRKILL